MAKRAKAKLSASLEDYLEAIHNLAEPSAPARSKDIAEALGVSRASVTGALQVLREKGLANYTPYKGITLTKKGSAAAAEVAKKHSVLKSFFVDVLGVENDPAQKAACRAEHALGPEIIERILSLTEFAEETNTDGLDAAALVERFHARSAKRAKRRAKRHGRTKTNK